MTPAEAPKATLPASTGRHEMTRAATVAGLAIGPRTVHSHDAARLTLHRWRSRNRLCSWQTQASSYLQRHRPQRPFSTLTSRWCVSLGDGSSNDKIDGWDLDTGATHHMTGQQEFFTELDSSVRGSDRFGDTSGVEIMGVGSVVFTAESGEHRMLTGVYYIPALRNSINNLGELEEKGLRIAIADGVLRIWDRQHRLLVKVTRGASRL